MVAAWARLSGQCSAAEPSCSGLQSKHRTLAHQLVVARRVSSSGRVHHCPHANLAAPCAHQHPFNAGALAVSPCGEWAAVVPPRQAGACHLLHTAAFGGATEVGTFRPARPQSLTHCAWSGDAALAAATSAAGSVFISDRRASLCYCLRPYMQVAHQGGGILVRTGSCAEGTARYPQGWRAAAGGRPGQLAPARGGGRVLQDTLPAVRALRRRLPACGGRRQWQRPPAALGLGVCLLPRLLTRMQRPSTFCESKNRSHAYTSQICVLWCLRQERIGRPLCSAYDPASGLPVHCQRGAPAEGSLRLVVAA